jgi:hypothetical protein
LAESEKTDCASGEARGGGALGAAVGRGSRLGFFNIQSSRTLARIEESARTINPTTQRLRATVKNKKRNVILKV